MQDMVSHKFRPHFLSLWRLYGRLLANLAWLFNRTNGSVFLATLAHTSVISLAFKTTRTSTLTSFLAILAIGLVIAVTTGGRLGYPRDAIASLVVIMAFAGMTGPLMSELANNQPTPWLGAFERINAYTTFAWMVVLAVVLIRRTVGESSPDPGRTSVQVSGDRALATTSGR